MPEFETLGYEESEGVARVTLDRPEVLNSFNTTMQRELRTLWRWLRRHDAVRVVVLTGAGERAFCTGIDRSEAMADGPRPGRAGYSTATDGSAGPEDDSEAVHIGSGTTPFMFDDPGENLGPKSNDLWKPVIAAVNGIACGGAFYMLGEVDFIIAAEHATFFDPHLTFNMAAAFEPLQMTGRMPFGDLVRLTLLGSEERMSAQRALQIGLVTEVVPAAELRERAGWAAGVIAKAHPVAVQGTLRALWAGRELSRGQALGLGWAFVGLGNDPEALAEGQQRFASGERVEWRLR
ncbi:MAG TPA: enoyl-CoA hydratase/isomerase family protein [Acidimicrobiales bacterium]|nr:enoyl-CoA hydratase/isomerase family protein [Acidimicrobiales bacterium]